MKKSFIDDLKERQRTISFEQSSAIYIDESEQRLNRSLSKVTKDKIFQRGNTGFVKSTRKGSFDQDKMNRLVDGESN